jgi:hypothetical protein
MDLLTTYTHHSELQVIMAPLQIYKIPKSPKHPKIFQLAVSSSAIPWQRLLTVDIVQLLLSSQSRLATVSQLNLV